MIGALLTSACVAGTEEGLRLLLACMASHVSHACVALAAQVRLKDGVVLMPAQAHGGRCSSVGIGAG